MKRIIRILPNLTIILSLMFITLWILDKYNPMMNFLDSEISNILLLLFFAVSLLTSALTIALDRKLDQKLDQKDN